MAAPDYAHEKTDRELEKLERKISGVYQKARDDLRQSVDDYFERFRERDAEMKQAVADGKVTREYYKQWRLNQIGRGKRFEALRDKMAERYTRANETAIAYVNDATPGIYSLNRNHAAYTIDKATGGALTIGGDGESLNADFILFDEQTVKRLIVEEPDVMPYYPPARAVARGIDLAYGKSQITKNVTSGILRGLGVKEMSDELQERISTMERTSAIRAARTAVTAAQNAGRMDSYHAAQGLGIRMKKQWLATLDARTRHEHQILDGQTAEVDDDFTVNGEHIRYPGDPKASPHMVYNCRCTLISVLSDFHLDPGKRRARGETADAENKSPVVIEAMTYAEWAGWVKKGVEIRGEGDIIQAERVSEVLPEILHLPDEMIGRSLGAKAKNYDILDLQTGDMYQLSEGSYLRDIQVFAGKGTKFKFRDAGKYAERYGGAVKDWQHVKGKGLVETADGDRLAELHWAQCAGIGKQEMFVKRWLDES